MSKAKYYSIVFVPDESGNPKTIKFRRFWFKFLIYLIVVGIVALVIAAFFYGRLVSEAMEAKGLRTENEALMEQHTEYLLLKQELEKNREIVSRIKMLAGIDTMDVSDSLNADSTILAEIASNHINTQIPYGYPLRGFISKRFTEFGLFGEKHLGLDITCPEETFVHSTADGVVEFVGWDDYFGNLIRINHQNGYESVYAHNKESRVEEGEKVKRGDVIALSGNSGISSGPHLHYEVLKNGKPLDPERFLE